MKNKDPLKVLLVDEKQGVDFSLLANLLKHFVIISKESKEIEFLAPFYGLKNKDRILIVLFATKARAELFKPGNKMANFLACTRSMVLIIGSNIFVHAGLLPEIVNKYNIQL